MARVQIAERRPGERWKLVAHGAAYDKPAALELRALLMAKGVRVQFLALPQGVA